MSSREGGFPVVLDRLGYQPHHDVSICYQPLQGPFSAMSTSAEKAPEVADDHADTADVYFGANPVGPTRSGRGRVEDVIRLTSLWADLDVKPGGMPSMAAARAVIDDISDVLGTRPAAVIESGHGSNRCGRSTPTTRQHR
jgi:hypothetical protein